MASSKRKADDIILVPMVHVRRRRRAGVTDLRVPQVTAPGVAHIQVRNTAVAPSDDMSEQDHIPVPEVDINYAGDIIAAPPRTQPSTKKLKEVNNWNNTVPLLVEPYSHLMMNTNSMRGPITSTSMLPRCSCNRPKVCIVSLIYMDRKS